MTASIIAFYPPKHTASKPDLWTLPGILNWAIEGDNNNHIYTDQTESSDKK